MSSRTGSKVWRDYSKDAGRKDLSKNRFNYSKDDFTDYDDDEEVYDTQVAEGLLHKGLQADTINL
jgi:hypothetical protein